MASNRRWQRMFDQAWDGLVADDRLIVTPRRPTLSLQTSAHDDFMAKISGRRELTLAVAPGFAEAVEQEVNAHASILAGVVLGKPTVRAGVRQSVVGAAADLAVLFVMYHELSHLIGGHVDWLAARPSRSHSSAFDEVRLGVADASAKRESVVSVRTIREAYYLEVEADGTGLQALMQSKPPASLTRLITGWKEPVADATGTERLVTFRLLMAVTWLVIRLTEVRRDPRISGVSPTHPRPAARLLSAIATLLEQYAVLTELRADAAGQLVQQLSAQQADDSRTFINHILAPIMRADWARGKTAHLSPGSISTILPDIVRDLLNLLLVRKAMTPAGIELERLERLRRYMNRVLAPYRYMRTRMIE